MCAGSTRQGSRATGLQEFEPRPSAEKPEAQDRGRPRRNPTSSPDSVSTQAYHVRVYISIKMHNSFFLSLSLSLSLDIYIYMIYIYTSIYPSVCLSIFLSTYLSTYLPMIYLLLDKYLSAHLHAHLHTNTATIYYILIFAYTCICICA